MGIRGGQNPGVIHPVNQPITAYENSGKRMNVDDSPNSTIPYESRSAGQLKIKRVGILKNFPRSAHRMHEASFSICCVTSQPWLASSLQFGEFSPKLAELSGDNPEEDLSSVLDDIVNKAMPGRAPVDDCPANKPDLPKGVFT